MANGIKHDAEARALWGDAYDAIPKSVFAAAAWHLAYLAGDGEAGGTVRRFREEIGALGLNGIIPEAQAMRAIKALRVKELVA